MRIIGCLNILKPVLRIAINPKESHFVVVIGNNFIKLYKIRENSVYL